MNNFDFLKSVDKNLYEIISDAEKLYRDEYFEQCITQTRRFGENICKCVLGKNRTTEKTFDDMLATLSDKSSNEEQEKEFLEDLYFLKREGNASVHSNAVKKDAFVALECLQRAFEVGISYALYRGNYDKKYNLLKLRYDTEMLVTGEKTKQTLAEKYAEEKARANRGKDVKLFYYREILMVLYGWIKEALSAVLFLLAVPYGDECGVPAYFWRND